MFRIVLHCETMQGNIRNSMEGTVQHEAAKALFVIAKMLKISKAVTGDLLYVKSSRCCLK